MKAPIIDDYGLLGGLGEILWLSIWRMWQYDGNLIVLKKYQYPMKHHYV